MSVGDINLGAISAEIKLDLGSIKGDVAQAQTIIQNFAVAVEQNITQKFGSAQKSASASLLALETSIHRVANTAAVIGTGMLGAAGAALKAGSDMERTFQRIQANTTLTDDDMKKMTKSVKDMARESGAPLDGLAKGFMHAANFGFDMAQSQKIVQEAMKGSVATGADVERTSQLLAKSMKSFGIGSDEASHALNTMVTSAKLGDTTLEQFNAHAGQVYAMAANMGVSFTDTNAALSLFAQYGLNASEAAVQLKNMIKAMEQPTQTVQNLLEHLSKQGFGVLKEDFTHSGVEAKGWGGIMQDVSDTAQKMGVPVGELAFRLFPGLRGSLGALIGTGKGLEDYHAIHKQLNSTMKGESVPVQGDYAKALGTSAQKMEILQRRVQLLAADIGEKLMPSAIKILEKVQSLVTWFDKLSDSSKTAVGNILWWGGGSLVVIAGIGKITAAVMGIVRAFQAIGPAAAAARTSLMGGLMGPMGLTAAAGIGIGGAMVNTLHAGSDEADKARFDQGDAAQKQNDQSRRARLSILDKIIRDNQRQLNTAGPPLIPRPDSYFKDLSETTNKLIAERDELVAIERASPGTRGSKYLDDMEKRQAAAAGQGGNKLPSNKELRAAGRGGRGFSLHMQALHEIAGADVAGLTGTAKRNLQQVDDFLASIGSKGSITSGKRSGGPPSYHNSGNAVDIVLPGNMQAIATKLREMGFAAQYESKGQVNANGSVATGNHIHITLTKAGKILAAGRKGAKAQKDAEDEKEDKRSSADDAYDEIAGLTLPEYQKKIRDAMREWQQNQKDRPVALSAKLFKARVAAADKERAEQNDQKQDDLEEKQKRVLEERQTRELEEITTLQEMKRKADDENDKRYEEFEAKHKKLEADRTAEELAGILEKQERERKFQERKLSFEVESGIISKREYVAILEQKLDAEEVFSDRWIEISLLRNRKLKEIEDDAASDLKKQAQQKEQWMAPFKGLAEGISGIFENSFQHLLTKGFKGFFDGILQGFTKMLQQMIAKWMAAQVLMGIGKLFGGPIGAAIVGAGMSMGGFDDGDNDLKARRWGFDFQDMFDRGRLDAQKGRNIGMAAAGAGGGGHNITIHMGGVQMNNAMDARQTAREIAWQIQDSLRVRPGGGAR